MVNTFVTSSSPRCVRHLDDKRLNKQRVEACQILDVLEGRSTSKGWINHPATLMWKGHTEALKIYINCCIYYWKKRGKNCNLNKFEVDEENVEWPWWFKWKDLHLSHKCSLLRKKPDYYEDIFELDEDEMEFMYHGYIWPTDISKSTKTKIVNGIKNGTLKRFEPNKVCRPIGTGAPPQWRWSLDEVNTWLEDKNVNPKTNRKISSKSKNGIYSDMEKAYNYYVSEGLID